MTATDQLPTDAINSSEKVTMPNDLESSNISEISQQIANASEAKDPGPSRDLSGLKWFCVCIGIYLTALLYGLDTTIAADVQVSVLESLGEIEKLSWVGIGFPMGSVATILLLGCLYNIVEIKWLYLGSIILFEIGSAICGAAPTMNALIIGRVIAGVGGAGMYLGCLTYISIFTSLKERPVYNGMIGLCWGVGCILGPIVGGAFSVSNATWRWAFYINLVFAALTAPIYIFWLPRHSSQPQTSFRGKMIQVDWVGAVLNALSFALFMIVLNFAGAGWAWKSARLIILWIAFGASVALYSIQQAFCIFTTAEHRLFPVQFLKRRTLMLLYFGSSCAAAATFVAVYYVPLYFQFTKGDSAIKAAVRLLPFIIVDVFAIMFSGALLPVFGRYMPWYLVSGVFILAGSSVMYTVDSGTSDALIYGLEVLIAIGAGLTMQTGYSIAVTKVLPNEVSAAIGFINVAQLGSTAITLAISGCIFQNLGFHYLHNALLGTSFTTEELRSALAGVQSVILTQGDARIKKLATDAIVKTISSLYGLVIGAGALMLVSSACMKREKLNLKPEVAG